MERRIGDDDAIEQRSMTASSWQDVCHTNRSRSHQSYMYHPRRSDEIISSHSVDWQHTKPLRHTTGPYTSDKCCTPGQLKLDPSHMHDASNDGATRT